MELVEKDQLVNYLKNAVELENQVYGLNEAVDQSKKTIDGLKGDLVYRAWNIKKPVDKTNEISKPVEPVVPVRQPKHIGVAWGCIGVGILWYFLGASFSMRCWHCSRVYFYNYWSFWH